MTDQEINIAIAEACGQKYHKPTAEEIKSGSYHQFEPDYCSDLNAMHEAESTLTEKQMWPDYYNALSRATGGDYCMTRMLRATARQRAEAFLRTIGKWKE